MEKQSLPYLPAFAALLILLTGCATPTPPDVGRVVVAPQVKLPPPPVLVQQTQPRPVGHFQNSLLNFFSSKPQTQTP